MARHSREDRDEELAHLVTIFPGIRLDRYIAGTLNYKKEFSDEIGTTMTYEWREAYPDTRKPSGYGVARRVKTFIITLHREWDVKDGD